MTPLSKLFDRLWADYLQTTPHATRVHGLLAARGETVVNDHVALRTFGHPRVDIEVLDRAFVQGGYEPADSYEFPAKKLHASHYEHPDPNMPKIFVSALMLDELSAGARAVIDGLVSQLETGAEARATFAASGRGWDLDWATYEALREESEYAAWVAAFGFRANHFTVDAGKLTTFAGLAELNAFLVENGFELNDSGGLIKGGPALGLEQSSTRAQEVEVAFVDGKRSVPSGYVEFARRYELPGRGLFTGFLPESADRLFESTERAGGD